MAKNKLVEENEKIAKAVVGGYKKIEDGETVEQAKARLAKEQAERAAAGRHKPE